eukprot:g29486.t1
MAPRGEKVPCQSLQDFASALAKQLATKNRLIRTFDVGGTGVKTALFSAPSLQSFLEAEGLSPARAKSLDVVESGGGQMVTGYVAKRDFMNQKLFDGVEDLPREVSEVQAIAIVPSLRQLRRSLLESSAGGLHAWTNGAFVPVDSEPPAERTLENNALMAQEARKLPRCGLILFSGSLESFSTVLEKTSPDDPTFTDAWQVSERELDWIEAPTSLGQAPGEEGFDAWLASVLPKLQNEKANGHVAFGDWWSAGGHPRQWEGDGRADPHVAELMGLPRDRTFILHDGAAHLLGCSRCMVPPPRLACFSVGTGVGFGISDEVRARSHFLNGVPLSGASYRGLWRDWVARTEHVDDVEQVMRKEFANMGRPWSFPWVSLVLGRRGMELAEAAFGCPPPERGDDGGAGPVLNTEVRKASSEAYAQQWAHFLQTQFTPQFCTGSRRHQVDRICFAGMVAESNWSSMQQAFVSESSELSFPDTGPQEEETSKKRRSKKTQAAAPSAIQVLPLAPHGSALIGAGNLVILLPEVRPSKQILQRVFKTFREQKQWSLVYAALEAIRKDGNTKLDVSHFMDGMSTCTKANKWQHALILFNAMPQAKVQPDIISCSAAINACQKGGQWQGALSLIESMSKARFEPDLICHNAAISACEKGGQWQHALKLFEVMPMSQVQPDVISYNAAISACEKGGQWQHAMNLFGTMPDASIQPNIISCSAAISACEKGEQWQQALTLLDNMPEAKMQPDLVSYSAAISACEKGGQWQQALKLFEAMPKARVQANVISYSAAISACEKGGQWQQALKLFEVMPRAKVQPDNIIYNAVISACEKGGQWQKALKFFDDMPQSKVQPNVISYNAAISACEKGGQLRHALDLFYAMSKASVQPNVISYSATISACEQGGHWRQALLLFEAMPEADVVPNVISYNSVFTRICGIEIDERAESVTKHPFTGSTAFMLGNEGEGMSAAQRAACDFFVYIPQHTGATASLNVAIAGSIVLHHFATWAQMAEHPRQGEKYLVEPLGRQSHGATAAKSLVRLTKRRARRAAWRSFSAQFPFSPRTAPILAVRRCSSPVDSSDRRLYQVIETGLSGSLSPEESLSIDEDLELDDAQLQGEDLLDEPSGLDFNVRAGSLLETGIAGAALSLEAATATAAQQAARAQMQLAMGRLMENTEEKGAGRSAPETEETTNDYERTPKDQQVIDKALKVSKKMVDVLGKAKSNDAAIKAHLRQTGDPLVYDDGSTQVDNATDPGKQVGELAEGVAKLAKRRGDKKTLKKAESRVLQHMQTVQRMVDGAQETSPKQLKSAEMRCEVNEIPGDAREILDDAPEDEASQLLDDVQMASAEGPEDEVDAAESWEVDELDVEKMDGFTRAKLCETLPSLDCDACGQNASSLDEYQGCVAQEIMVYQKERKQKDLRSMYGKQLDQTVENRKKVKHLKRGALLAAHDALQMLGLGPGETLIWGVHRNWARWTSDPTWPLEALKGEPAKAGWDAFTTDSQAIVTSHINDFQTEAVSIAQEEGMASADTIYQGHLAEHVDAAQELQTGAEELMAQGARGWNGTMWREDGESIVLIGLLLGL